MFVMMRHAERGDQAFPPLSSSLEYDPPITQKGRKGVITTAKNLATLIKQNQISTVQIHSSPFLRCLMTAEQLHSSLNIMLNAKETKVKDKIQVNNMFGQFLRIDWFETLPFQHLLINSPQSQQYIDRSKFILDKSTEDIIFPQNMTRFCYRVGLGKDRFVRDLPDRVCRIIVTHGFVVKELCVNSINYLRFRNDIEYCEYEAVIGDRVLKYLDQPLEVSKL